MDGFDRLLDRELARVLDPIVNTPAPQRPRGWRAGRGGRRGRLRTMEGGLPDGASGSILGETVPIAAPAAIVVPSSAP